MVCPKSPGFDNRCVGRHRLVCCKHGERLLRDMKFKVFIDGGIGFKEVKAKEIDDVYAAAIKQFGCRKEDILAAWSSVAVG